MDDCKCITMMVIDALLTDHSLTANLFDHLVKDFENLKESLPTVTAEVQNW